MSAEDEQSWPPGMKSRWPSGAGVPLEKNVQCLKKTMVFMCDFLYLPVLCWLYESVQGFPGVVFDVVRHDWKKWQRWAQVKLWWPYPTTNGGRQNVVGICIHFLHILARLAPICMLSWWLLTKFLHWSSGGRLLRMRSWLGVHKLKCGHSPISYVFFPLAGSPCSGLGSSSRHLERYKAQHLSEGKNSIFHF